MTEGWPFRNSATAWVLRQCSRIRSGKVSRPWMNWKALNGLIEAPRSRNRVTRALMRYRRSGPQRFHLAWVQTAP